MKKVYIPISILLGVVLFVVSAIELIIGNKHDYKYLNDKDNLQQVRCLLKTGELSMGIIYNYHKPYISVGNPTILTTNYIQRMGLIPRWTQMSKEIDQWLEEKQRIKDSTDKANLQKEIDNICN